MDPASTVPGIKRTCLAEASSVTVVLSAFRPESRILGLLCRIFDGSNRRPNWFIGKRALDATRIVLKTGLPPNRSRMIKDARPIALEVYG